MRWYFHTLALIGWGFQQLFVSSLKPSRKGIIQVIQLDNK
jgi:hypothetical protein